MPLCLCTHTHTHHLYVATFLVRPLCLLPLYYLYIAPCLLPLVGSTCLLPCLRFLPFALCLWPHFVACHLYFTHAFHIARGSGSFIFVYFPPAALFIFLHPFYPFRLYLHTLAFHHGVRIAFTACTHVHTPPHRTRTHIHCHTTFTFTYFVHLLPAFCPLFCFHFVPLRAAPLPFTFTFYTVLLTRHHIRVVILFYFIFVVHIVLYSTLYLILPCVPSFHQFPFGILPLICSHYILPFDSTGWFWRIVPFQFRYIISYCTATYRYATFALLFYILPPLYYLPLHLFILHLFSLPAFTFVPCTFILVADPFPAPHLICLCIFWWWVIALCPLLLHTHDLQFDLVDWLPFGTLHTGCILHTHTRFVRVALYHFARLVTFFTLPFTFFARTFAFTVRFVILALLWFFVPSCILFTTPRYGVLCCCARAYVWFFYVLVIYFRLFGVYFCTLRATRARARTRAATCLFLRLPHFCCGSSSLGSLCLWFIYLYLFLWLVPLVPFAHFSLFAFPFCTFVARTFLLFTHFCCILHTTTVPLLFYFAFGCCILPLWFTHCLCPTHTPSPGSLTFFHHFCGGWFLASFVPLSFILHTLHFAALPF